MNDPLTRFRQLQRALVRIEDKMEQHGEKLAQLERATQNCEPTNEVDKGKQSSVESIVDDAAFERKWKSMESHFKQKLRMQMVEQNNLFQVKSFALKDLDDDSFIDLVDEEITKLDDSNQFR